MDLPFAVKDTRKANGETTITISQPLEQNTDNKQAF
jgi:hypothetical protein